MAEDEGLVRNFYLFPMQAWLPNVARKKADEWAWRRIMEGESCVVSWEGFSHRLPYYPATFRLNTHQLSWPGDNFCILNFD